MTNVAVLDDYLRVARDWADWDSLGPDVACSFFHDPMSEAALVRELANFEVLCLMRERSAFPRRVLEQLPRLRLVLTTGMVNASIDLDYLRERAIPCCGTENAPIEAGVGGPVELAWSLIFALVKRTVIEDKAMRAGRWQLGTPTNLSGTTLGLAGLGRLGSQMVGPARSFGMNVIAWSQNLTAERAKEVGAEKVSKEALLERSDVLSIHLVLSDRTRGLFGVNELSVMKKSAVLVNTSRGPIVDERALIDVLRSNAIGGAGLDVYDREPIAPDNPLLTLENTVLAPHLGYVTEAALRNMYAQTVENIAHFLEGRLLRVL